MALVFTFIRPADPFYPKEYPSPCAGTWLGPFALFFTTEPVGMLVACYYPSLTQTVPAMPCDRVPMKEGRP